MRKTLLTIAATCMWLAGTSAFGQGKTCEEAAPWSNMAMVMDLASYADGGAWYKVTPTANSMLPFSLTELPTSAVQVFKGCNGEKALVMSEEVASGNISYYIESGVEYMIKLDVSQATGSFVMAMATPLDLSNAPDGNYCVKPINASVGMYSSIKANRPTWFKVNIVYPGMYSVGPGFSAPAEGAAVTSVKVKSGDCGAVENSSNLLMPNQVYAKAGENFFCVTCSGDMEILFQMASPVASCPNRPERMTALSAGVEVTYPNAVYENYWRFIAPETATYQILDKAPQGTILQVGTLDENDDAKFFCNFENGLMAEVDESGEGKLLVDIQAGQTYVIASETFNMLAEGVPSVKISKDETGVRSVSGSSRDIKVSKVAENEYRVSSYLLAEGAGVYVYDMAGRAVSSLNVRPEGDAVTVKLAGVPAGTYMFLIVGRSKSASTKVLVD